VVPLKESSIDGVSFSVGKLFNVCHEFPFLFVWGALTAFFPLYAISHGVAIRAFLTTIAIMLILGRALGGKTLDLYSREKVILPCLFTYVISMVLLTFSKTLPMFLLVCCDLGDWERLSRSCLTGLYS